MFSSLLRQFGDDVSAGRAQLRALTAQRNDITSKVAAMTQLVGDLRAQLQQANAAQAAAVEQEDYDTADALNETMDRLNTAVAEAGVKRQQLNAEVWWREKGEQERARERHFRLTD